MNDDPLRAADAAGADEGGAEELTVLLFSVMGTPMGVDVEQISEVVDPRSLGGDDARVFYLHEKVSFGGRKVVYEVPKALLIKGCGTPAGIIVDRPEDIRPVPFDSIRPMPAVVEGNLSSKAIWGIALIDDEIVLLIDFRELVGSEARAPG